MNKWHLTLTFLILTLGAYASYGQTNNLDRNYVDDFIGDHLIDIEEIDQDEKLLEEHRIEDKVAKLVADKKVILPTELNFKGQKRSLTKWGSIDIDEFLSWNAWKKDRLEKDSNPQWETAARERSQNEMVGRIYQCVGRCKVDRGEGFFFGSHRTNIYEGDDIETEADSYLWIFLFDGTMIRLSPMSSLSLNEFNVGVSENFINARLNYGNMLWLSRSENQYEESNHRETDVIFFPYANYETIPVEDVKKYDEDNLFDLISGPQTHLKQVKKLNQFIEKNNQITNNKKTYAFIVLPNATIMGFNPNIEMIHLIGDETHLKLRSNKTLLLTGNDTSVGDDISMQLRGLENKTMHGVPEDEWITVNAFGTSYGPTQNDERFSVGEFLTKRPTRILLGREIFLENYSKFVFQKEIEPLRFASEYGYRLWGKIDEKGAESTEDLTLRIEYLKEYARRIETTNLKSKLVYYERLKNRGLAIDKMEYGEYFYAKAMEKYYLYGERFRDTFSEEDLKENLNSTKKTLWKKMHGIR